MPPLNDGAVHASVSFVSPRVTVRPVGAPGKADGVTLLLVEPAVDESKPVVAITVNEYDVPLVNPGTEYDVAVLPVLIGDAAIPGDTVMM